MKTIYLAGGCFWGVEKYFSMAKGVVTTKVGYANGHKINPSYFIPYMFLLRYHYIRQILEDYDLDIVEVPGKANFKDKELILPKYRLYKVFLLKEFFLPLVPLALIELLILYHFLLNQT